MMNLMTSELKEIVPRVLSKKGIGLTLGLTSREMGESSINLDGEQLSSICDVSFYIKGTLTLLRVSILEGLTVLCSLRGLGRHSILCESIDILSSENIEKCVSGSFDKLLDANPDFKEKPTEEVKEMPCKEHY